MRAIMILAAMTATASADPVVGDSWLEVGLLRAKIAMPDGHEVQGYAVSFSPRLPLRHHLYAGAELDRGDVSGSITTPAAFRQTGGEMGPTSDVVGNFTSIRLLLGIRARAGVVSAGGEVAAGFHREEFTTPLGVELGTVEATSTQLEARARVDLWITPKLSLGAIAGADDQRAMSAGLVLGLHFGRYDGE